MAFCQTTPIQGRDMTPLTLPVAGSIFEEMAEILASGDFEPSVADPVAEGETVIGTMTDFEKALYSARNRQADRANAHTNQRIKEARGQGKGFREIIESISGEIIAEKAIHSAFAELLWASIRKTIGRQANEGSGIGMRENYQILQLKKECDSCGTDIQKSLREILSEISMHIMQP